MIIPPLIAVTIILFTSFSLVSAGPLTLHITVHGNHFDGVIRVATATITHIVITAFVLE